MVRAGHFFSALGWPVSSFWAFGWTRSRRGAAGRKLKGMG